MVAAEPARLNYYKGPRSFSGCASKPSVCAHNQEPRREDTRPRVTSLRSGKIKIFHFVLKHVFGQPRKSFRK